MHDNHQILQRQESAHLWTLPHLGDLSLLRATFVTYRFKRHSHDYFVLGLVEAGVQRFTHGRHNHTTLPGGLIVINPGEAHTGQAAIQDGFHYRALYPSAETMADIAAGLRGRVAGLPCFPTPVIDDPALFGEIRRLHVAFEAPCSALEYEGRYLWALGQLIARHARPTPTPQTLYRERNEVQRVRRYIEEHYSQNITLAELAALVHWSPFYLLRVFRQEVGLPPHAYLESVRIRRAQTLLKSDLRLADIAYSTGFSSQSHFTTSFKNLIGVTPGQYRAIF